MPSKSRHGNHSFTCASTQGKLTGSSNPLNPGLHDLVSTALTARSRYKIQVDIVKQERNIILSCNKL